MTFFQTILIPVTAETDEFVALKKVIELFGEDEELHIHMVYIITKASWNKITNRLRLSKTPYRSIAHAGFQTTDKSNYSDITRNYPGITIHSDSIELSTNNEELLTYVFNHKINLLVHCKNNRTVPAFSSNIIDVDKIAHLSPCAVLNITVSSLLHPIKSILIPIGLTIPERKIQIAILFARHKKAAINLLAILDNPGSDESQKKIEAFYRTYKMLKECGHTPNHTILERSQTNEVIIAYAKRVKIDLVILDPAKKSFVPDFIKRTYFNRSSPDSPLQILKIRSDFTKNSQFL